MIALDIEETSGVDHPAHLDEGFIVLKSAQEDTVPESQVADIIKGLPAQMGEAVTKAIEEANKARDEAIAKQADMEAQVTQQGELITKQGESIAKFQAEQTRHNAEQWVKSLKSLQVDVDVITKLAGSDLEESVKGILKSADEQVTAAGVLKATGLGVRSADSGSPFEVRKAELISQGMTPDEAVTKIATTEPHLTGKGA